MQHTGLMDRKGSRHMPTYYLDTSLPNFLASPNGESFREGGFDERTGSSRTLTCYLATSLPNFFASPNGETFREGGSNEKDGIALHTDLLPRYLAISLPRFPCTPLQTRRLYENIGFTTIPTRSPPLESSKKIATPPHTESPPRTDLLPRDLAYSLPRFPHPPLNRQKKSTTPPGAIVAPGLRAGRVLCSARSPRRAGLV